MKKKHPRQATRAHESRHTRWQFAAAIVVVIGVVAILVLKQVSPSATSSGTEGTEGIAPTPELGAEPETQDGDALSLAPADDELPQAHLERMLSEGQPILAFFHSDTCYQCIEMTKIVNRVYPDFEDHVALVDVNVYDERNRALLQRAEIRVIPTLIFFDRSGSGQGFTGVMPDEQLEAVLTNISSGETP